MVSMLVCFGSFVCVLMRACVCIYIYIYIYTEREHDAPDRGSTEAGFHRIPLLFKRIPMDSHMAVPHKYAST